MSTQSSAKTKQKESPTGFDFRATRQPRGRVERFLDLLSTFLSPILIKEARQAIKSRQLAITLTLLFLSVLVWSIACAVNARIGQLSEAEQSSLTIGGFALCLAMPLFIVVPFWAFSSMSNEIDETTYDLVLCTTLKPWQIVAGKLSAALAQMMIYLSVVAPCFAFCSVLPGTDLPALIFILSGYAASSFGLSALGLLMGTPRSQVFRVLSMILFFAFLLLCFMWAYMGTYTYFDSTSSVDYQNWNNIEWSMYLGALFGFVGGPIGTGILFAAIAAGAVSPKSANRSTPVRIAMCICWLIMAILLILPSFMFLDGEWYLVQCFFGGAFALITGGWLLGEKPELSRRVRRHLPTTTWADMLVCWLLPGPGRGYVFSLILFAGIALIHPLTMMLIYLTGTSSDLGDLDGYYYDPQFADITPGSYPWTYALSLISIGFVYVGGYLSAVWLFILMLKHINIRVNCVGSLIITACLFLGSLIVWAIMQQVFNASRESLDLFDQINGPYVMMWWFEDYNRTNSAYIDVAAYFRIMFLPTIATFGALLFAAKELGTSRVATPDVVVADEAANQPTQPSEVSFDDIE